jgi:hypothetical protein
MTQVSDINWKSIAEPVITIARAAGIDPIKNKVYSIFIDDEYLIVRYVDDNNVQRHISCKFEL